MKRNGGQNGNDVVRTNFPCPMCWEGSNLFSSCSHIPRLATIHFLLEDFAQAPKLFEDFGLVFFDGKDINLGNVDEICH